MIGYFWVKIPDIQLLRKELNMRNVIFDEKTKIMALKKILIKDERERDHPDLDRKDKSFLPFASIKIYSHLLIA